MEEKPIINQESKPLEVVGDNETLTIDGIRKTEDAVIITSKENGKQIVNTILVDEVRFLIKNAIQEIIPRLGFKVLTVSELPASGEFGIIYLVSKEGGSNDEYDEYIWVIEEGEEVGKWEFLGSSSIDLTNYVTTNTEQTITGIKSVDRALGGDIKITLNGVEKFAIYPDFNTYNTKMNVQNSLQFMFTSDSIYSYHSIVAGTSNIDLGGSSTSFRNLYLSGVLSDGTNSVTIANIITINTDQTISGNKIWSGTNNFTKETLIGGVKNSGLGWKIGLNIVPEADNYGSIGSSSRRVGSIYVGTITDGINSISPANIVKKPSTSYSLSNGATITDDTLKTLIQNEQPIKLNNFTCYFSCDDGTNYQYVSTRYDATANKNHINVIAINKSTWVATFHTSDLALS